ncbi:Hypothetical predicted protein [Xyrichtys novacula]|uniref:Uncharacterized protein n=1 Tax=Xyrichtys novacula TaxID=13765 RepID=A0AAV1HA72_XYRNO|nr:Hypothetical predicted protein [Xyrichtys novacula]
MAASSRNYKGNSSNMLVALKCLQNKLMMRANGATSRDAAGQCKLTRATGQL